MPPKKDEQSAKFYPIGFSLDDWKYLALWNNTPVDWAQYARRLGTVRPSIGHSTPVDWAQYEIDAAAREKEGKSWKPPWNATTQLNTLVERMRLMAPGGPHRGPGD